MMKKKTITILITVALVLVLISTVLSPPAPYAATVSALAEQIDAVSGLSAFAAGNVVTVTNSGAAHRTTNLPLTIDPGVTVNWNATLTGNATANNYLLTLSGGGTFTLGGGGVISVTSGAGGTVYISGGVTLNITNGSIESPGSGSAVTIAAGTMGAAINVNGASGRISSVPNGYAINDGSGMTASDNNTRINISAGLVESGSACAIRSTGFASIVTVSGGVVKNNAASNTNSVIYMNYAPAPNPPIDNIIVSGGIVETVNPGNQSYVLQTSQNVRISGGEVKAIAGRAINLVGKFSTASVTGGRVLTDSGTAISTATTTLDEVESARVLISGGVVEATGTGTAMRITGANSTVAVSGDAKVLAKSGLAIDASGRPADGSVKVGDGLVFAWGNAVNKVISPESKLLKPVGGVVAAWNTATGTGTAQYSQGTKDDLTTLPAMSVTWDDYGTINDFPDDGIRYTLGGIPDAGFHSLDVEVIRIPFTLTIVNGTDEGGRTSVLVPAGAPVNIITQETPITPGRVPGQNPINGNRFIGWVTGGGGSFGDASSADTTFTMPGSDVIIMATFKPLYLLRITGGRFISPLTVYGNSYGYYAQGDIITIEAFTGTSSVWVKNPGWHIAAAVLGIFSNAALPNTTFTMPGEPAYIYVDSPENTGGNRPQQYTTTVEGGLINTTSANTTVNAVAYKCFAGTGLNISADATPLGMLFDGWTADPPPAGPPGSSGSFLSASSAQTLFITPNSDVTIIANYIKPMDKTYSLTVNDGTGSGFYREYEEVSILAADPPEGMEFCNWTIDSGGGEFVNDDPSLLETEFIMPDSDAVITANYEYLNYTLTVQNGVDVLVDVLEAGRYHNGETIPVSADEPPAGMKFGGWTVLIGGGSFDSAASSDAIFTMPAADATIRANFTAIDDTPPLPNPPSSRPASPIPAPSQSPPPGDVSHILNTEDHIAYVIGIGHGLFAPDKDMTRAETANAFYNLLLNKGVEITRTFPDVPEDAWYAKAVSTLASMGILTGRPDGRYYPDDSVTRTEFVAIAVRFTHDVLGNRPASVFTDVPDTHWAHDAVVTATSYGWISGIGNGLFAPDRHISRAEAVTLMNRLLNRVPDKAFINNSPGLVFYTDTPQPYWAYYEITEASNTHNYIRLEGGGEEWTREAVDETAIR